MLGVTPAHVYQSIEQRGLLKAERVNGRVRYSRDEVDVFASTYVRKHARKQPRGRSMKEIRFRGELTAQVFPLLVERKTLVEIAIATGIDPAVVRELKREFDLSFEAGERAIEQEKLARKFEREERARVRERYRQQKNATAVTSAFGISARKTA